jgi:hypothetical protein
MARAMLQWPRLRDVSRRQRLMDDMMARCGADVLEVVRRDRGRSFAEAYARCQLCSSASRCSEWLTGVDGIPAAPTNFCANACLFRLHPMDPQTSEEARESMQMIEKACLPHR